MIHAISASYAMTITVFGSVNVDVIAYADRLPRPGETVHGSGYAIGLGGKGANQAVAVARLGSAVELAGAPALIPSAHSRGSA